MKRLAAIAALLLLFAVAPGPAGAATTSDYEHQLLTVINQARAQNGLEPLRLSNPLWDVAGLRAGRMAASNVLSHTVAGSLSYQISARHVPWYGYGEAIGYTPATRGSAAVSDLFKMWKNSPEHWALITSSHYNYVGIGLSYRSSNGRTFGSLVFTESRDLTGSHARVTSVTRIGQNVVWNWEGWDPRLQTHTSGLDDFDVQRRDDRGTWRTVISGSQRTTWVRWTAPHGHTYGLRVRARDNRGNVGPWSSEMRIWVP